MIKHLVQMPCVFNNINTITQAHLGGVAIVLAWETCVTDHYWDYPYVILEGQMRE